MECRFCCSENTIKSEKVRNKQRYECKGCKKYFVTELSQRGFPAHIKLQALEMLKEGMGFRSVKRLLKVSLSPVLKWFKNKALIIKQIVNNKTIDEIKEIDVVEIDDLVEKIVFDMAKNIDYGEQKSSISFSQYKTKNQDIGKAFRGY